jgi:hypothetical protein
LLLQPPAISAPGTATNAGARQRVRTVTAMLSNPKSSKSSSAPVTGRTYKLPTMCPTRMSPPELILTHGTFLQAHHLTAWSNTTTEAIRVSTSTACLLLSR